MAVQFILGRSGSGKTSCCIKAVVSALLEPADNQPLLFLVPEQATYQAERSILSDKRIAGYNRLHVLSFDRLQFWLLGKNTARPELSRIGRQMIVHRILRDNKSKLKIFGPSATWPGLSRQIAETIAELHQYAKTPDDINQLISEFEKDERNNLAVLKFTDIALIFKEYLDFIEGKFIDPDIQLSQACRAVVKVDFAKGARLWVDGFAGFTTSELAILTELLKVVADAQIALCLDPSEIDLKNPDVECIDTVGIFGPTQRTYAALIELIKKCNLQLAKPIILDEAVRFSSCPHLAHIERNVFEVEPSKIPAADNIRIISAPNARAEVRFVARQILQLVKEKGYRYRDIAVIASDINGYEHYIRAYFDDYGVPFFMDKRKTLNQHPAIQLICSALQVVTGGFSQSDIFAYLKTDLVPIERNDVDLLENYCLAFGITGGDWQSEKDWHFAAEDNQQFDEERINQVRLKVVGPLFELRDALCPAGNPAKTITAEDFTRIIFVFLDRLQIRQTLEGWIAQAAEQEDYPAVDEHRQFYDKLINIFDELVEVFAGQQMSCQDYPAILSSAFSQLTLAFIPPSLDQVLVGSIERSRHPDLKAVFLIGATQRQFPVPVKFDSILTEDDRTTAESANFLLAATAGQKLAERQYLAYIAFTRPSEFLYVIYPAADDKGSAIPHSQFIDNLQSLFENLNEESITVEPPGIEQVHNKTDLTDLLCSRLGRDVFRDSFETSDERYIELLNSICSDEQLAELGSNIVSAINYDNRAKLDSDVVEELFGQQIRSSATKLGTFAACPYQYFARYILALKEREEFKFEPLDLGLFYHRVLDSLLKRLNTENKDFATVQDKELLKLLKVEIEKLVQTHPFISNFVRRSPHNAFIIHSASEVLEDCVLAIAQMARAGIFRPALSEVAFGQAKNTLETIGEYEITLPDGRSLALDGKIDRLDIADIDGEKFAIVFDYKRREMVFSWPKFYFGLDLQLPIYLLAVTNAKDSNVKEAAGAFYIPVEAPTKQATLDELSEKNYRLGYKAKGIFNGNFAQQLDKYASKESKYYNFYVTKNGQPYGSYENRGALKPADFEKILKFTQKKIIQLAQEILSSKIDVTPYRLSQKSPCGFCKYQSICRFDWQINDYNFLESLDKTNVLEKMGRQETPSETGG